MGKGNGTTRTSSATAPNGVGGNDRNGGGYQRMDRSSFIFNRQAELDDLDKRTSYGGDLSRTVREADREYFRAEDAYKNSLRSNPAAQQSAKQALDEADERRRKANAEYDRAIRRIQELRYIISSTR